MFLGMQNDLIAFVTTTKEEIENLKDIKFTDIIETDDVYVLENGSFVRQDENYFSLKLKEAKEQKLKENSEKLNKKRYGQVFTVTLHGHECVFDTSEQTQSDLQTAAIVTSSGETYDNWVTNNGVCLNLSADDVRTVFSGFFPLVSPLYQLDLQYKNAIQNALTVEDVNSVKIIY